MTKIIAAATSLFLACSISWGQASRPANARELGGLDLKLRAFSRDPADPVAGGLLTNFNGVIVTEATVEVDIIKGKQIIGAHTVQVSSFDDVALGKEGAILPGRSAHFTVKHGFSPLDCAPMDAYWLVIKSATVRDPAVSPKASFEDLCADVFNGNVQFLEEALKADPQVANLKDNSGLSLMHVAAASNDVEVLSELIRAGGDVHASGNSGLQPIHSAAAAGATNTLAFLMKCGADPNAKSDLGWRPLHYAVIAMKKDSIGFLAGKADMDATTGDGVTPLMLAAIYDYEDEAVALVEGGASLHVADREGLLPLHTFAATGSPEIVEYLVRKGIPVDVSCTAYEYTPLQMAARSGNVGTAQKLLQLGANPNVKTQHGNTAADLAKKYGHADLAVFLKSQEKR